MEIEGILKQKYITAKDLQKIIPGIGYVSALKMIEKYRKQAEEMNYYNPRGKTKVALTWLVKKDLGIKWGQTRWKT